MGKRCLGWIKLISSSSELILGFSISTIWIWWVFWQTIEAASTVGESKEFIDCEVSSRIQNIWKTIQKPTTDQTLSLCWNLKGELFFPIFEIYLYLQVFKQIFDCYLIKKDRLVYFQLSYLVFLLISEVHCAFFFEISLHPVWNSLKLEKFANS